MSRRRHRASKAPTDSTMRIRRNYAACTVRLTQAEADAIDAACAALSADCGAEVAQAHFLWTAAYCAAVRMGGSNLEEARRFGRVQRDRFVS